MNYSFALLSVFLLIGCMSNNYQHALKTNKTSVYKKFIQKYKSKDDIEAKTMVKNSWLAIDKLEFEKANRKNQYEAYDKYLNNDSPQTLKPNKTRAEVLADKSLLKVIKQNKWPISRKSEYYIKHCYTCKPNDEFSYLKSFSPESLRKVSNKNEAKAIHDLLCIDLLDQYSKKNIEMDMILSSVDFKYCSKLEDNENLSSLFNLIKNAKNNISKNAVQIFINLYKNPMLNVKLAEFEFTRFQDSCKRLILEDGTLESSVLLNIKKHLNVIKILLEKKFNELKAKQINSEIDNLFNHFYTNQERNNKVKFLPRFVVSMDTMVNVLKDIGIENENLQKLIFPRLSHSVEQILISLAPPKLNLPARLSEKIFLELKQDDDQSFLSVMCEDRTFYRTKCKSRSTIFKNYDEIDRFCTTNTMQMTHKFCQIMSKDFEKCIQSTLDRNTQKKDQFLNSTINLFEKLARKGKLSKKYLEFTNDSCLDTEELEQISYIQSASCNSLMEVECQEDQRYSRLCDQTLKKRTLQCDMTRIKYIRKVKCKDLMYRDLVAMCNDYSFFDDKNQLKCDKIAERRMRQCRPVIEREEKKYCSHSCKKYGQCTFDGTQCIIGSDRDCRKSKICKEDGQCTAGNDRCIATTVKDCRKSTDCRNYGECDLNYSLKTCHPGNHLHCRRSKKHCRKDNFCTFYRTEYTSSWDGEIKRTNYCGPRTDLDCERSSRCKLHGLCERSMIDNGFWKGWSCLPTDEGCAKSKDCRTEGKCVTEYNKRFCQVSDESCKKSLTCRKDGNCVAGEFGECTTPEDED